MSALVPTLPQVWRPRRGRIMPYVMAAAIDITMTALAFTVSGATTFDRVGFLVFAIVATLLIHRLANVRAVATTDGLTVVNWARRRQLEWAEVIGVRLGSGDPWLQLDISDGTTLAVMAVQTADGPRAHEMAREVAAVVSAHSSTGDSP